MPATRRQRLHVQHQLVEADTPGRSIMKEVLQHIAVREARFAAHPFFSDMRMDRPIEQVMAFAPRLTFWVMTFQDVLRLNAHFIQDAHLKALATRHHAEEGGHDQWFEEDISALTGGSLSIGSMYGRAHVKTRDAAYAIISEVYRPVDDRLRIVLLWALESTSHVFFSRTAIISAAQGADDRLKYFSDHHMQAEAQHAMFEQELAAELEAMQLAPQVRADALAMVDRIYAAFDTMFDGLRVHLEREHAEAPAPGLQAHTATEEVLPLELEEDLEIIVLEADGEARAA
ncbi:hypothetical protein HV826_03600 [Myxococcus sp. AM010]|nr:hypothetical protein [Myxococcus sp. AM010]